MTLLQLNHETPCFLRQLHRTAITGTATQTHHQIKARHILLACTKHFPQHPFHPVAVYGKPFNFTCHYQSQSGMRQSIGFSENLKQFPALGTPEPDDRGKFFRLMQAMSFRKTNNTVPSCGTLLDSETNPSFGAPSPDYRRPARGFHADPETVGPLSARHGWLVSAFHYFPCA